MKASLTCIVIDDDILFVRKMEALIDRIDWLAMVSSFTEPVKAASAILRQKPDVIFLDLDMPHMDGYALVDWLYPILKIKGLHPHIVAVSGNELGPTAMQDQFLCHISKSKLNDHQTLSAEVEKYLGAPLSA